MRGFMTCLGSSHPPCSYYFNGVQLPPDHTIHISGFGGEDASVTEMEAVSSSTLIGSLPITHTHTCLH